MSRLKNILSTQISISFQLLSQPKSQANLQVNLRLDFLELPIQGRQSGFFHTFCLNLIYKQLAWLKIVQNYPQACGMIYK